MRFEFFSKNGQLLPMGQAVVSVFNIEYAYGFGVYENIRVQNHLPLFLQDHIERLFFSANAISLKHTLTLQELKQSIIKLINTIQEETYNIKILLIGAKEISAIEYYILPLAPLFPDHKLYQRGATANVVKYERFFPQAKTLNMLPSYYFYSQAKKNGCYDVLFCDHLGNILEGSRTNFFVIKNRVIYTAPAEKVLEGVTKKHVLQVARDHGFAVIEQNIPLVNLKDFDGAFLTSTSSKIVPLTSIVTNFDKEFPPQLSVKFSTITPTVKELMGYFNEFLSKYIG